ncbi:MAG: DUF1841 family protein [Gammaproteobacteria bacterium]|nr:DUF1841 family protein [Gammaproteobacteria bacterium]
MFGNDRGAMRKVFFNAWNKAEEKQSLDPLEQLIVETVGQHPEYHVLLNDQDSSLDKDFSPDGGETNPFLHMGMHISLLEQIQSDRPGGIRIHYQQLTRKYGDAHQAEHQMMECLGLALWEAQRSGKMPDEQAYLRCLQKLSDTN